MNGVVREQLPIYLRIIFVFVYLQKSSSTRQQDYQEAGPSSSNTSGPSGVELESIISQVKDLLPDLGDGFIQV